jgi:hypothetical protein
VRRSPPEQRGDCASEEETIIVLLMVNRAMDDIALFERSEVTVFGKGRRTA